MKIEPRTPTRPLNHEWPFLFSVDPKRGLVKNVAPEKKARVRVVIQAPTSAQTSWPFPPDQEALF